jgi:hypothetical protein
MWVIIDLRRQVRHSIGRAHRKVAYIGEATKYPLKAYHLSISYIYSFKGMHVSSCWTSGYFCSLCTGFLSFKGKDSCVHEVISAL